ncbi:acyltransferase family protein [Nocardioides ferulae]|uniref:acyltransferase family protein n=1 Tax=Nocardioides ferulae TaxID=2340821 RepID=UPI0013DDC065|nr:acyltransferase family protein [Nocardioides ferulae]
MRRAWMDQLRGAAILAVLLLHAQLVADGLTGEGPAVLRAVNTELAPVRMPLLVALSGMLVGRSLAKGRRRHVRGKLEALAWPYLVWGVLDVAHVLVDTAVTGAPVPWAWLPRLAYDPSTYLWFLGYLLVFHLAVTPLGGLARTLALPVVWVLAGLAADGSQLQALLELFRWFLLGDLLWRAGLQHLDPGPAVPGAAGRLLGHLGIHSVVYYVCHLLAMVYAARLLVALDLRDPWLLTALLVVVPLVLGRVLVAARSRSRWADALFVWPASSRRGGAPGTPTRGAVVRPPSTIRA